VIGKRVFELMDELFFMGIILASFRLLPAPLRRRSRRQKTLTCRDARKTRSGSSPGKTTSRGSSRSAQGRLHALRSQKKKKKKK